MLTVRELAMFFEASAARAKRDLTLETLKHLGAVARDAEALIGQELDVWPPLADSTVAEKERLGYTGQVSDTDPLLRTGELRGSIEADAEGTATGVEGVIGSNSQVALWQEMGTAKIPPRPFLATAMARSEGKAVEQFGELAVELLSPGIR